MVAFKTQRMLLEIAWHCHGDHIGCYRRRCMVCKRFFYTSRPESRHCQPACRQYAYRQRQQRENAAMTQRAQT